MRFSSQMSLNTRCRTIEPALWVVKATTFWLAACCLFPKIIWNWSARGLAQICFLARVCPCFPMRPRLVLLSLLWPALLASGTEEKDFAALYARGLAGD